MDKDEEIAKPALEKQKTRDKKREPKMKVTGKSVFQIQNLIRKKPKK